MTGHGVLGYREGCRCFTCRKAWSAYHCDLRRKRQAAFRSGKITDIKHGLSGYNNYGCRCPVCLAAGQERNRIAQEKRQLSRRLPS